MNLRKKLAILIFLGLISPFLISAAVIKIENPLKYETFDKLVEAIINFIFNIALVLAPLMIIIGAFYFITAGGIPEKIKTGKTIITYTLIGLVIVLLAKGIIVVLRQAIGVR